MPKVLKKSKIIFSILALFLVVILFLYLKADDQIYRNNGKISENNKISQVCIKNKCFDVEIANTPREREIGLMDREYLAQNSGMLFVFEKGEIYNFWMKNTLVPLDIIWIDESNKIIFIKENAEPCKTDVCEIFSSNEKAKYVLEINGGLVGEVGLKVNDAVEIR